MIPGNAILSVFGFSLLGIFSFLPFFSSDREDTVTEVESVQQHPDEVRSTETLYDLNNIWNVESSDGVNLLFAADTHFVWGIKDLQKDNHLMAPVEEVASIVKRADFSILNLETVLANGGAPLDGKVYIFSSNKRNVEVLNGLGIDLVAMANNHAMDMGLAGMMETEENLRKAGIPSIGAGQDYARSMAPFYREIKGIKYAFLSFNEIGPPSIYSQRNKGGIADLQRVIGSIRHARNSADHVIVYVHWGREYMSKPTKLQRSLAHRMINAGASIIVGHHPHVPQGIEFYKEGVIFYSLGNFLFGSITPGQTENILVESIFNAETKRLQRLRITPITGRYSKHGHSVRKLGYEESVTLWEELIYMTDQLHADQDRIPDLRIKEDGTGEFVIEQD